MEKIYVNPFENVEVILNPFTYKRTVLNKFSHIFKNNEDVQGDQLTRFILHYVCCMEYFEVSSTL